MNVQIARSMFDGAEANELLQLESKRKPYINAFTELIGRGISDKWKFSLWILYATLFLALGLVKADSLHKIVYPKNFA